MGPYDIGRFTFVLVFFLIDIGLAAADSVMIAVVLLPIRSQLVFFNGFVIRVIQPFFIIFLVHIVEVMVAAEDNDISVGRDAGPLWSFGLVHIILEQGKFSGGQLVFEMIVLSGFFFSLFHFTLLFFLLFILFFFILFFLILFFFFLFLLFYAFFSFEHVFVFWDFKIDKFVVFNEFNGFDREMLGIIGVFGQFRQHCGQFNVVKDGTLLLFCRVDDTKSLAFTCLIDIPEAVTVL
ncbi:hypothetical protein ES703_81884 [subsurface metagenome]